MADTIRLTGLQFFTVIGDLPHERTQPQPLEVDIDVTTDTRAAAAADALDAGLDYRALYRAVAAVAETPGEPPRLLETFGERIATGLLALRGVDRVRVRCRKPWAALPGPVERVEIEIERP
ncbi:MAG: dihydroneopterin aldolase [Gemmatimonadota bacterium]